MKFLIKRGIALSLAVLCVIGLSACSSKANSINKAYISDLIALHQDTQAQIETAKECFDRFAESIQEDPDLISEYQTDIDNFMIATDAIAVNLQNMSSLETPEEYSEFSTQLQSASVMFNAVLRAFRLGINASNPDHDKIMEGTALWEQCVTEYEDINGKIGVMMA